MILHSEQSLAAQPATGAVRVLLAADKLGYDTSGLHGLGRLMLDWTRALLDRGVDVLPVVLRGSDKFRAIAAAEGAPIRFLGRGRFDPLALMDLARIIRTHGIQVLHLNDFGAGVLGRVLGEILKIPTILHVHADYRLGPRGYPAFVQWCERTLASSTDVALAVSDDTRRFAIEVQGLPPERVEVWHNPVDRQRFRPPTAAERAQAREALRIPRDCPVALTVGRIDRLKGIDVQIDAWPEVARHNPDARLLIVGDGAAREELEARSQGTDWGERVWFLGQRTDVRAVLWAADVFVISSRHEGLPLAVVEAMACGLPVIATQVGGLPEVVTDNVNGHLVPSEHPALLADALGALLSDPIGRAQLSRGALQTSERYDLKAYAERLEALYRARCQRHSIA